MIGLGPIKNESWFSTQGIQRDLAPQQLQLVATPVPLICVHIRQIPMRWSYFLMHFSSPVFQQAWFLKYYADSLLSRKIQRWQNADIWYHEEGRHTYLFHKFFLYRNLLVGHNDGGQGVCKSLEYDQSVICITSPDWWHNKQPAPNSKWIELWQMIVINIENQFISDFNTSTFQADSLLFSAEFCFKLIDRFFFDIPSLHFLLLSPGICS